jgi:hypothetical protein
MPISFLLGAVAGELLEALAVVEPPGLAMHLHVHEESVWFVWRWRRTATKGSIRKCVLYMYFFYVLQIDSVVQTAKCGFLAGCMHASNGSTSGLIPGRIVSHIDSMQ